MRDHDLERQIKKEIRDAFMTAVDVYLASQNQQDHAVIAARKLKPKPRRKKTMNKVTFNGTE